MISYLDTSVILRNLFREKGLIPLWGEWKKAYTSELTLVECLRALDRLRISGRLGDQELAEKREDLKGLFDYLDQIRLTPSILKRASEPHPTSVATLDALHLASAYLWREHRKKDMTFLTHDRQQGIAARALGFSVLGCTFEA